MSSNHPNITGRSSKSDYRQGKEKKKKKRPKIRFLQPWHFRVFAAQKKIKENGLPSLFHPLPPPKRRKTIMKAEKIDAILICNNTFIPQLRIHLDRRGRGGVKKFPTDREEKIRNFVSPPPTRQEWEIILCSQKVFFR